MSPSRRLLILLLSSLWCGSMAGARRPDPAVVYDSDYAGYVPIVDEIGRPDLVTHRRDGRVPESLALSIRRARSYLAGRGSSRGWAHSRNDAPLRATKRWLRRHAIRIDLAVVDPAGQPIRGARVFVASDPSFYAVNDDGFGARLFAQYRYLPYGYSEATALADLLAHSEYWTELRHAPVIDRTANIDERHNPWLRDDAPAPTPPLSFAGTTDGSGLLQVVSGWFNLKDRERFARAIVPDGMRLIVLIVADGYAPGVASWRFTAGGVREARTVSLLAAPFRQLFASESWVRMGMRIDHVEKVDQALIDDALLQLQTDILRLPDEDELAATRLAEARLWDRAARRSDDVELRFECLRRAFELRPEARLAYQLGLLASQAGSTIDARAWYRQAVAIEPRFRPAWVALDRELAAAQQPAKQRAELAEAIHRIAPFDRWARARISTAFLKSNRASEAFDHLRYTWSATPGMGGDRELAEALFNYYWLLGLPEKAGTYLWLYSGQPPEDTTRRSDR
jgi:tetratricopeptide (TPR) repeat protein